jgi:hypothetical protein
MCHLEVLFENPKKNMCPPQHATVAFANPHTVAKYLNINSRSPKGKYARLVAKAVACPKGNLHFG